MGADGMISRQQNGAVSYYLKNAHGDIVYTLKDSRTKTATYKYSAWGETTDEYDSNTSSPNPIKYSGEYEDSESGMIYLRGRYYDPELRRFITEDPAKDGLNWYAYCGNNPVMYVDPTGEDAVVILNSNGALVADYVSSYDGESKLGHMAICVQDSNVNWFYFSISTEGITKIDMPSWALNDSETFNYWLSSYWSDYDTATYIAADTSAAYDYFNEQFENNTEYNWALNNCSEFVINGLKEAVLYDGTKVSNYLWFVGGYLPKTTMKQLSEKFYNNCWNYTSYRKVINDQLWEATEGENRDKGKAKDLFKLYY